MASVVPNGEATQFKRRTSGGNGEKKWRGQKEKQKC